MGLWDAAGAGLARLPDGRLAAAVVLKVTLCIERCGVHFSSRYIECDAESKLLPGRLIALGAIALPLC
jgi:hypothetical protein